MGNLYKINESLFYAYNEYVEKNPYLNVKPEKELVPLYVDIKDKLPKPFWDNHEDVISCYNKAWEIAFGNLHKLKPETGFVSNFIDTAFNGYLFMWDSSFIVMFGRYASHIFDFQKTLDNFYSHQHRDGFICREICEDKDGEQFHRDDPCSTGPNILPWSEWEYYKITGDKDRLKKVFYPLLAYHKWLKLNRTWRDGSYWSTGLACGMDNQPRVMDGYCHMSSHAHSIWVDTCIQMVISGKILIKISNIIDCDEDLNWLHSEVETLTKLINEKLWNDEDAFYYDLWPNSNLNRVKSIGAYWALLADLVPKDRLEDFLSHLKNEKEFNRPHKIPSLSADHPLYQEDGGYWKGGVWAPTNYMVLKGLDAVSENQLAFDIAKNTLENIVKVFNETGTLWENYSPEKTSQGNPAKSDFVGWTGLVPISIFFEYVLGIRADAETKSIVWHINLIERHGIEGYPFEGDFIDLICESRKSTDEKPIVKINSNKPIKVILKWNGNETVVQN